MYPSYDYIRVRLEDQYRDAEQHRRAARARPRRDVTRRFFIRQRRRHGD